MPRVLAKWNWKFALGTPENKISETHSWPFCVVSVWCWSCLQWWSWSCASGLYCWSPVEDVPLFFFSHSEWCIFLGQQTGTPTWAGYVRFEIRLSPPLSSRQEGNWIGNWKMRFNFPFSLVVSGARMLNAMVCLHGRIDPPYYGTKSAANDNTRCHTSVARFTGWH